MRDYRELVQELRTFVYPAALQAADAIEELQSQMNGWIEQDRKTLLKSVPRWISVKDRLPIRGDRVLVTNGGFVCEAYLSAADNWIRGGVLLLFMTPTHWMELPKPPKEDENG